MIEELLSNILLIGIALCGVGYLVTGSPKKYVDKVDGKYIKKDNFTLKIIKFVIGIFILSIIASSI